MANIDEELLTIKNEEKGENVRAAIISAIKKIHNEKEYPPSSTKFTNNGTYEGGPWNKVVVDVAEGGADLNNIDDMSQSPITENGYYTIADLIKDGHIGNEGCIGINGLTVNVSQAGELGEIYINENGEYDPLKDGFDGYSKVYVNVFGNGKPGDNCRLRFYDSNGNLLYQQTVPYGADFTYEGPDPKSGGVFIGWNPSIQRVSGDQDFYAQYQGQSSMAGAITDDWHTIIVNMKAGKKKYALGSIKEIILQNGSNYVVLMMTLVAYQADLRAEGSGYAFSTWINTRGYDASVCKCLSAPFSSLQFWQRVDNPPMWENSILRASLNDDTSKLIESDKTWYNNSSNIDITTKQLFTNNGYSELYNSIVKVKKYSTYMVGDGGPIMINKQTDDLIWIPSDAETVNIAKGDFRPSTIGPKYGANGFFPYGLITNTGNNTQVVLRETIHNIGGGQRYAVNAQYTPEDPSTETKEYVAPHFDESSFGSFDYNSTEKRYTSYIGFCL